MGIVTSEKRLLKKAICRATHSAPISRSPIGNLPSQRGKALRRRFLVTTGSRLLQFSPAWQNCQEPIASRKGAAHHESWCASWVRGVGLGGRWGLGFLRQTARGDVSSSGWVLRPSGRIFHQFRDKASISELRGFWGRPRSGIGHQKTHRAMVQRLLKIPAKSVGFHAS